MKQTPKQTLTLLAAGMCAGILRSLSATDLRDAAGLLRTEPALRRTMLVLATFREELDEKALDRLFLALERKTRVLRRSMGPVETAKTLARRLPKAR
jgi:hypothetical protein